jgi:hypothetical protein
MDRHAHTYRHRNQHQSGRTFEPLGQCQRHKGNEAKPDLRRSRVLREYQPGTGTRFLSGGGIGFAPM